MKRVRFVQVGEGTSDVIHHLTLLLTRLQDAYEFVFVDDAVTPTRASKRLPDGMFEFAYIEQLLADYVHKKKYTEYVIAISNIGIPGEYITSSDDRMAIVDVRNYQTYCDAPLLKLLEYLVGSVLTQLHLTWENHEETRGCPNDKCDNLADVAVSMVTAEFCEACRREIVAAVESERMAVREIVGISRILDHVAGRRICFALMPFGDDLDPVYAAIKSTATSRGFKCIRADEIFEPRTVVQIVYEMIGRAELVIADLTGKNANVFYELGYAHASGRPTVIVTQNSEDIPFNLKHRQCVEYDPADLPGSLIEPLRAYLK